MMLPGMKNGETFARAAGQEFVVIVFDRLDATNSGAHRNADRVTVLFGDFEPGVLYCLDTCCDPVVDERVGSANVLCRHVVAGIEISDHAADASREYALVSKSSINLNAGISFAHVRPGFIQPIAYRRDDSHAGNNDASFFQGNSECSVAELPSVSL